MSKSLELLVLVLLVWLRVMVLEVELVDALLLDVLLLEVVVEELVDDVVLELELDLAKPFITFHLRHFATRALVKRLL